MAQGTSEVPKPTWFARRVQSWCDRDRMKLSERAGDIAGIVVLFLLAAFFVHHQVLQTGFFTSAFGPVEEVLFYTPVAVGIAVSLVRLATGRRNIARPLEFLNTLVWIVAGYWFFTVFPFDFTRLADALPSSLRFLLSWVPNWLGKATILIAGLAGVGNAVYLPALYVSVRRGLAKRVPSTS